ncbi:hypothetical protein V2J52_00285 [Georgenia sp. MJ173]|uniref:hypothetical protein n=1 Tax=Georgenia sunbinii TaxID=3117728 RepID=UPI002F2604FB
MLLAAGPTVAWGLWSHSVELDATTASAGVVAAPATLQCSTEGGLLGLVAQHVELSWPEPAGGEPDGYIVRAEADGELFEIARLSGGTRSFELKAGLLTGVLQGLLDLIIGGARPALTVTAVHGSGWESAPTASVQIRLGLLGLTGVRCA